MGTAGERCPFGMFVYSFTRLCAWCRCTLHLLPAAEIFSETYSHRLSCAELNLLYSYERRTTVHRIYKWGRCFVGHWVYFSWLCKLSIQVTVVVSPTTAMRKIYHKFIRIFTLRLVAIACSLCAVMQMMCNFFYSNRLVPIVVFTHLFGRKTPTKRNNHMGD